MDLRLALRFSYAPNKQRLCGKFKPEVYELLEKENWTEQEEEEAREFIQSLKTLRGYIQTIAEVEQISEDAALKVYLIGRKTWKKESAEKLSERIIDFKLMGGLPELPENTPFTHTFHVLYTGFLVESDGECRAQLYSFDAINQCKVTLGRILTNSEVEYLQVNAELGQVRESGKYNNMFKLDLKEGDWALFHYGIPFYKLNESEVETYRDNFSRALNTVKKLKLGVNNLNV